MQVPVRELISGMGAPLTGDGRGHEGEKRVGGVSKLERISSHPIFLSGDAGVE